MGMGKYKDGLPEKIIRFNKYIIYCFKQLYNFTNRLSYIYIHENILYLTCVISIE